MSHDGASSDVGDIGELKVGEVENRSLESKSESEISKYIAEKMSKCYSNI